MKSRVLPFALLHRCIFLHFAFVASVSARPPAKGMALDGLGTIKRYWIDAQLTLSEAMRQEEKRRIEDVISWCKLQLDDKNVWIINGVRGKGAMPDEAFKRKISHCLEEPTDFSNMRRKAKSGDTIFHFTSKESGDGYILVRNQRVIYTYWRAIK